MFNIYYTLGTLLASGNSGVFIGVAFMLILHLFLIGITIWAAAKSIKWFVELRNTSNNK